MKKQVSANDQKLKGEVQSKRNRDIKCFKCRDWDIMHQNVQIVEL